MGLTHKEILNPGSKKRLLDQLDALCALVEQDADRDMIMFRTAELMPVVANQFAYVEVPQPNIRVPRRYTHKKS